MTLLAPAAGRAVLASAALAVLGAMEATAATHFLVVEGLGGRRSYAEAFREQVEELLPVLRETAGESGSVRVAAGVEATAERVGSELEAIRGALAPGDELAVILIGHGSHDGRTYKFNLPGPDLTDRQLKAWLDAVPAARQLVVSTTSSSGGALATLKSPRRVVITATKNGRERNATVFGRYWVEAFSEPSADTDKNEAISALEAFRYAEGKVAAHFADSQRLATEHPQIEGQQPGSFVLARLGAAAELAGDPRRRGLLERREALERKVADLAAGKESMSEGEYLDALQEVLLELAEVQERIGGEEEGP